MTQFRFMAGMPRSGSTMIASILAQNPMVHIEGLSALQWLMLNASTALDCEQTHAAKREQNADYIVSQLPSLFYEHVTTPIVIDRSRGWATDVMRPILKAHFDEPKVLVTVRDRDDVIRSLERLHEVNGRDLYQSEMWAGFVLAEQAVEQARASQDSMYLFIDYDEFCDTPQDCIRTIYDFWQLKPFDHRFDNLSNLVANDEAFYGLKGMHDVRPTLSKLDKVG